MSDEIVMPTIEEEMLEGANYSINKVARELGYKPFLNPRIIRKEDGSVCLGATCPLCGEESEFNSVEEINIISSVTAPNGTVYNISSCPVCIRSRQMAKSEQYNRLINKVAGERVGGIVKNLFGATLKTTKNTMYTHPDEKIYFIKDGKAYYTKYGVIMAHIKGNVFEDIDDEYREDETDIVFSIGKEDLYATPRDSGERVHIEKLLLNPEKDAVNFVDTGITVRPKVKAIEEPVEEEEEQTDSDIETEKEPQSEEIVQSQENTETYADEPEVTDEVAEEDQSAEEPESPEVEETVESEETTEVAEETVEQPEDEPSDEEEVIENRADDEITVEDVESKSEESYHPDEEFSEESVVNEASFVNEEAETTEEPVAENKSDEIVINSDDTEEESGGFFGNFKNPFEGLFGNNNSSDDVEETVSEETTPSKEDTKVITKREIIDNVKVEETDDGIVHIGIIEDETEGTPFPFHSASEIDNKKRSTIISEVNQDSSDEVKEESIAVVNEDDDDEFEEDIIVIKPLNASDDNTNDKKSDEEQRGYSNHIDRLGDESKKILEKDKKWYDNVVFEVGEDNGPINEFEDIEDLYKEFMESKLGNVIVEVKTRTGLDAQVIINETTCELPFVDFSSGIRIICIDCNNIAQMKVPVAAIERNTVFSYILPKDTPYRKMYLYSDSLNSPKRTRATILNLIKNVNRDGFDPRRIVNLAGNYTLFYTDSIPTIRQYEEENSSYPQGKPSTKTIAIIAMRPLSGVKEKFTSKDLMSYLAKNYKEDLKSNNLFMVAGARYIATFDHKNQVVTYTITDYNELATTIIKDGFDHIIGAIIKEHKANNTVRDSNNIGFDFSLYQYKFEYEYDPSTLPSPTLEIWNDNKDFWPTQNSYEDGQGKCYIRVPEYRATPADGYRNDPRLFLPIPLSKRFKADIEKNGVNVLIENVRRQFIERIGFIEAFYPRIKKFALNQMTIMKLEFQTSIFTMSKVDLNSFFSGNGVYDGSYDNILMQKFMMKSILNSDMDEQTKNMMNVMMISNMMSKKN